MYIERRSLFDVGTGVLACPFKSHKKGTVKKLFFTVPVELKGIGKRLQNEETEPKPSVSGYPKVYAIHREAKFIRSKKAQKKRKYYIKM